MNAWKLHTRNVLLKSSLSLFALCSLLQLLACSRVGESFGLNAVPDSAISTSDSAIATTVTTTTPVAPPSGSIFATTAAYPTNFGSLYAADFICQNEAHAAGLGGVWKAILSNSTVNAKDRIQLGASFYNMRLGSLGGPQLLKSPSNSLWDGSLTNSVSYDASGAMNSTFYISTGTNKDGTKNANTCNDWTSLSSGVSAFRGVSSVIGANWISQQPLACNSSYRLYCINQQTPAATPPDVTNLIGNVNINSASLSWVSGGGTTAAYQMSYQLGDTAPSNCNSGTIVDGFAIGNYNTAAAVGGLNAGVNYSFRVCATNSDLSSFSNGVTTTLTIPGATASDTMANIFSTNAAYPPNFGSLYAADFICQNEAQAAGYGGVWKAIVSNSTVNAKDRITLGRGFFNMRASALGGPQLVTTIGNTLWDGSITNTVAFNASGVLNTSAYISTGTNSDGTASSNTCNDWTSRAGTMKAAVGTNRGMGFNWVSQQSLACNTNYHLFCVNQQTAAVAPPDVTSVATNVGVGTASLSWVSGGGTTAAYQVSYQLGATAPADCSSGTIINPFTIGNYNSAVGVGGLTPGANYSFRICASNSDLSAFSAGVTTTITIPTTVSADAIPYIFTTNAAYPSNFSSLYAADFICQNEAHTAGRDGVWKAILSNSSVNAKDRITLGRAFFNTRPSALGGPQLVTGIGNTLWDGSITSKIGYNAAGVSNTAFYISTGTNSDGTANTNTCNDWTSVDSSVNAMRGVNSITAFNWIAQQPLACNSNYRLYCINQQSAEATPPDASTLSVTGSGSTATLNWTSGGGTTAAYKIAYVAGVTAPADCNSGVQISPYTIGGGTTGYTVSGLTSGANYSYRICSLNSDLSASSTGITFSHLQ